MKLNLGAQNLLIGLNPKNKIEQFDQVFTGFEEFAEKLNFSYLE